MEYRQVAFFLATFIVASIFHSCNSYIITVDANAEECFFENVEADTKMGLTFEIAEGGFLDIDVTITGPDGGQIYKGERESLGMYTFSAASPGRYTYCFSNKISKLAPKVVIFNLEVGDAPHKPNKNEDQTADHSKLDDMIKELGTTLKTVKHEQE